ncbi:MAG: tRNA pseudouridine(55) synthase TruB [Dethiosulfovibrio peptidovorans]|nr:MAG: tRNA pseudouridine(55) synthase TruB [Dethiosulfovibrio peptidovorans]
MSSVKFKTDCDGGFLVLHKPSGVRSTQCVSAVRRIVGKKNKVGHAGTLDSTAQGQLIVLVGKATRFCQYVMALPKTYVGTVRLGITTSTDDGAGEILAESEVPNLSENLVRKILPSFLGVRMQRPPAVSALKVQGQRAHTIVRQGQDVVLSPRPVYIKSIRVLSVTSDPPEIGLQVICHKGTYIRSVARDIGDFLGCGGHLRSLKRTATGPFDLAYHGIPFDPEIPPDRSDLLGALLPLTTISRAYATYQISSDLAERLRNGLPVPLDRAQVVSRATVPDGPLMVLGDGVLSMCRFEVVEQRGMLVPETNVFSGGEPL